MNGMEFEILKKIFFWEILCYWQILSMVEEAAGTRMYEAKKQAAQKTIEKKDAKLRELNDVSILWLLLI